MWRGLLAVMGWIGMGLAGPLGAAPALLTDPFLQWPTRNGVHVVWFTEFPGQGHRVVLDGGRVVPATSMRLSRMAEDARSHVGAQAGDGSIYPAVPVSRAIWRHEARVDGLDGRVGYHVESRDAMGQGVQSARFTLGPLPASGVPLRLLLTSDHQLKPMVPANLQKVVETLGRVDAVIHAGDLQGVPDRASGWFDDRRGLAFFPALQGRARAGGYVGGALIQHAPLFPVIGNHEVMGQYRPDQPLARQYAGARPRSAATGPAPGDPAHRAAWLRDESYNTISYEEIFTLPDTGPGGERFYEIRFGDVHIIALNAARVWRPAHPVRPRPSKYAEPAALLDDPDRWGWGEFPVEDVATGSPQHDWLRGVLASPAFRSAPVKIVVLHHPVHGVGDNSVPVFATPVQHVSRDATGRVTGVRYDYPREADQVVRDVEPLLAAAGVDLVLSGHSHVWYRTQSPQGVVFLESSNVGNTYGCYVPGLAGRGNLPDHPVADPADYPAHGDPHGYEPRQPNIFAPMTDPRGRPLPCVASNRLTVFSVLETGPGGAAVASYVFDTHAPDSPARLFDRVKLH